MSSIPRGPNHEDAAEPPTSGANLPRPGLDQTLVGVAPTALPNPPVNPAASPASNVPEAVQAIVADKPIAIVATPMIAVSGGKPEQQLDEPGAPGDVDAPRGLSRADADPALQSTALASDYLQAARDAALRKASVPRPRRPAPPALDAPSASTLQVTGAGPTREPTKLAASGSPMAAPPQSIDTQASVAPPLEAAETEGGARAPSPLPSHLELPSAPSAHGSAPAQPSIRRFEPVPTVRAPLWEQAPPSVGRPLTLDNGGPDWGPPEAASSPHGTNTGQRSRWYRLRWVGLAAAALIAVAFAIFGEQLTRAPEGRVKLADTATKPAAGSEAINAAPPEQTMLANHPARQPATAPSVADAPAVGTPAATAPASDENAPRPVIAPANAAPPEPKTNTVPASKATKKAVKRPKAKRKRAATPAASEPTGAEAR